MLVRLVSGDTRGEPVARASICRVSQTDHHCLKSSLSVVFFLIFSRARKNYTDETAIIAQTSLSVSYTHLDVYKRQVLTWLQALLTAAVTKCLDQLQLF